MFRIGWTGWVLFLLLSAIFLSSVSASDESKDEIEALKKEVKALSEKMRRDGYLAKYGPDSPVRYRIGGHWIVEPLIQIWNQTDLIQSEVSNAVNADTLYPSLPVLPNVEKIEAKTLSNTATLRFPLMLKIRLDFRCIFPIKDFSIGQFKFQTNEVAEWRTSEQLDTLEESKCVGCFKAIYDTWMKEHRNTGTWWDNDHSY